MARQSWFVLSFPWLAFLSKFNTADRKSTLIFCVNLSHVSRVTAAFRAAGIDARYLHSLTPAAERKALVAAFKAGEYPVLVNCGECDILAIEGE